MSAVISPAVEEETRVETQTPPVWLILLAFAAVYVIWGSTYLGIHIAIETIPPLFMAGARFLTAGAILYAVVRARGVEKPSLIHWRDATMVGTLLLLGGNGGVSLAQKTVPSGIAALVVAATPLWMILIDWLRPGGRRPGIAVFAGLCLGFAGVALIALGKDHTGHLLVNPAGAALLLAATLSWAFGSVFSRHAQRPSSPLLAIGMQMIGGGLSLVLSGVTLGETAKFHPATISHASLLAFVYLTLFGSLVGFTAYVWLLQVSTPARVSTYAYVNPLIAVMLGRLVLNEPLPGSVALAGTLILAAIVLISLYRARA